MIQLLRNLWKSNSKYLSPVLRNVYDEEHRNNYSFTSVRLLSLLPVDWNLGVSTTD